MKQRSLKQWLLIGAGISFVLFIILLAVGLSWSSDRFTRVTVCESCHEIFVDVEDYAPKGELSSSIEDFNPTEHFDPGSFKVTVGCGECHAYPYNEYRDSAHYDNDFGVRPGCVGCHNSHSIRQILSWKFFYVNRGSIGESPFHAISNSIRDVPAWEELRVELAKKVRKTMVEEKSVKCQVCHKTGSEWFNDIKQHKAMLEKGEKTCIHCHYNIVHEDVKWDKEDRE